jgi:hypothetical protein
MPSVILAIILFLSLVGYSLAWGRILRLPFGAALISIISLLICVLFVAALAGWLRPVDAVLLFGGIAALATFALPAWRQALRRELVSPAAVIFGLGFVVLFVLTRGVQLVLWDDFSHWGMISKFLLLADRFPRVPGSINILTYPPGDALFQYFAARLLPFDEGNLIFAHGVMEIAALLPLIAMARWRDLVLCMALVLMGISFGYFFSEAAFNWSTLLVDNLLAFEFAAAFMIYRSCGGSVRALLAVTPVLAALAITKETGLLFALMFAGLVLIDKMIAALWRGSTIRTITSAAVASFALMVVVPICFSAAWSAHLRAIAAPSPLDVSWTHIKLRLAEADFPQTAIATITKFMAALRGALPLENLGLGIPAWIAIIAFLTLTALAMPTSGENRARLLGGQLLLLAFFVVYAGLLLFYYLFGFDTHDALRLASFSRYMGTFLLAWLIMSVAMIVQSAEAMTLRWPIGVCMLAITGGITYLARAPLTEALPHGMRGEPFAQTLVAARRLVSERLGDYPRQIGDDHSVYVVWNGTSGLPYVIALYELKPKITNRRAANGIMPCFSIGPKRFQDDIWSCNLTPTDFRRSLENYDFLFLGEADEIFWDHYQSLFAPGARATNAHFFRIDHASPQGLLYLVTPTK